MYIHTTCCFIHSIKCIVVCLFIELLSSIQVKLSELYAAQLELNSTLHQLFISIRRIDHAVNITREQATVTNTAESVLANTAEKLESERTSHQAGEDVLVKMSQVVSDVRRLEHILEELNRTEGVGEMVLATAAKEALVSVVCIT